LYFTEFVVLRKNIKMKKVKRLGIYFYSSTQPYEEMTSLR